MFALHDRSPTAAPRILPALDHHDGTRRQLHFVLVREPDLVCVVTNHVAAQGYGGVDVLRSPVIEFSRCFFDGKTLRRGPIYYVDGCYGDDDAWLDKPESIRTWAKHVRVAIREALAKHGSAAVTRRRRDPASAPRACASCRARLRVVCAM